MSKTVKGFKAMRPDMTCRGFQFSIGDTFLHHGLVVPCKSGFHFCKKIQDIREYYPYHCSIFEVEASGKIFDADDKTVTNTLTVIKEIDYLDYVNDLCWWVRCVVAHHGIGLDVLVNDPYADVRIEVARQGYGLDKLVNDEHWRVRCEVAKHGYGLDKLICDLIQIRKEVAKQGYGLDILVNDVAATVRYEVAKQGYGLDILVNDKDSYVREKAINKLQELKNAK